MKRVIILVVAMALAGLVIVGACARPAPTPSPTAAPPPAPKPAAKPSPTAAPPPPAKPAPPKPAPSPSAQAFPEKPITWIIAAAPGGGMDIIARAVVSVMSKYLPGNATVVIENQGTPPTTLGLSLLNKAKPDGYTISNVVGDSALIIQLTEKVEWDLKKLTTLGMMSTVQNMMVARPDFPYNTIQDVVKAKQKVRFVTVTGTFNMVNQIVAKETGLESISITGYRGTGEIILGLARGDGDMGAIPWTNAVPYIKDKKLKPLFSLTDERVIEGVPSAKETGFPGLVQLAGYGTAIHVLYGPSGMPPNIASILSEALRKSVTDPAAVESMKKALYTAQWKSPQDTAKLINEKFDIFGKYAQYLK